MSFSVLIYCQELLNYLYLGDELVFCRSWNQLTVTVVGFWQLCVTVFVLIIFKPSLSFLFPGGVSRPRLTPERSTFAEGWKSGWSWTGVPAWGMDSEEGVISVTKLTGLVAAVQCVQAETMTDAVTGLRRWRRNGCRWNWNKSGQSCVMSCVQCITLTTVTMLTHLTATEWHGLSAGKCHCVLVMLVVVVTIIVVVAYISTAHDQWCMSVHMWFIQSVSTSCQCDTVWLDHLIISRLFFAHWIQCLINFILSHCMQHLKSNVHRNAFRFFLSKCTPLRRGTEGVKECLPRQTAPGVYYFHTCFVDNKKTKTH